MGPLNKLFNKVRPVVASAVLRFPVRSISGLDVFGCVVIGHTHARGERLTMDGSLIV